MCPIPAYNLLFVKKKSPTTFWTFFVGKIRPTFFSLIVNIISTSECKYTNKAGPVNHYLPVNEPFGTGMHNF